MKYLIYILILLAITAQAGLLEQVWARRGVAVPSFSPLSLSPKIWLDASDSASVAVTSSNTVSAWLDKSGNGWNAIQTTGAKQPLYSNAMFNARSCVAFNNTQWMQFTNLTVSATNYTIFVALRGRAGDSAIHDLFDAQTGRLLLWQYQTPNNRAFAYIWGSSTINTTITYPTNGEHVVTWDLGASPNVYLNGTAIGLTPTYTKTALGGTVILGARYSADQAYFLGDIGEFLIYGYTLSADERSNVWTYLKSKWGTP